MNYLTDEEYKFIYSKVPRICVDLIIQKEHGIILSKRDIEPEKDKWNLPGGRLFIKERISDALQRISKDELGIEVEEEEFLGFIEFPNEGEFHSVSLVFLTRYKSGELRGSKQAEQVSVFRSLPEKATVVLEQYAFLKKHEYMLFRNDS